MERVPGTDWLAVRVPEASSTQVTAFSLSLLGTPALNQHGLAWTSEYRGFLSPEQNCEFDGCVENGKSERAPQRRRHRSQGFRDGWGFRRLGGRENEEVSLGVAHLLPLEAQVQGHLIPGGYCTLSGMCRSFSLKPHCCPNRNLLYLVWLLGELLPTSPSPQNSPSQI